MQPPSISIKLNNLSRRTPVLRRITPTYEMSYDLLRRLCKARKPNKATLESQVYSLSEGGLLLEVSYLVPNPPVTLTTGLRGLLTPGTVFVFSLSYVDVLGLYIYLFTIFGLLSSLFCLHKVYGWRFQREPPI